MFSDGPVKTNWRNFTIRPDLEGVLFICIVSALLILFIAFSIYVDLSRDIEIYGDWMINYSFGFVRRGLVGWLINSQTMLSPPVALAVIHVFLYTTFMVLVFMQFWPYRYNILIMTLLFSPLGLFFFVYNHYTIGRKEVIFLVIVILQTRILSRTYYNKRSEIVYFTILIVGSVGMILSHEGLYFFCPFLDTIFFIYMVQRRPIKHALWIAGTALYVQTMVFLICYYYKGTYDNVEAICASLGAFSPRITIGVLPPTGANPTIFDCLHFGGIALLGSNIKVQFEYIVWSLSIGYPVTYGITALIGICSFVWLVQSYRFSTRAPGATPIKLLILLSLVWTIPLYAVGLDWGRWMLITYLTLLFLIVYLIDINYLVESERNLSTAGSRLRARLKRIPQFYLIIAATFFVLVWNPPYCCSERIGFGVIDLMLKLLSQRHPLPLPNLGPEHEG